MENAEHTKEPLRITQFLGVVGPFVVVIEIEEDRIGVALDEIVIAVSIVPGIGHFILRNGGKVRLTHEEHLGSHEIGVWGTDRHGYCLHLRLPEYMIALP